MFYRIQKFRVLKLKNGNYSAQQTAMRLNNDVNNRVESVSPVDSPDRSCHGASKPDIQRGSDYESNND